MSPWEQGLCLSPEASLLGWPSVGVWQIFIEWININGSSLSKSLLHWYVCFLPLYYHCYSPWNNPNHLLDSLFFKGFSHIGMPIISHWGVSCPVSSPAPHLAWFWSVVIIQIICHWEFWVLLLIPNTRHMGSYGVWREIVQLNFFFDWCNIEVLYVW